MRRLLRVPSLCLTLCAISTSVAAAQATGFVHLKTHVVSQAPTNIPDELGVSRTFVQGSNGLVETFTQEFSPGPHTFARVETYYKDCRATADNVSFTITAGQWTDVDVPVVFQDCYLEINMFYGSGIGDVDYSVIGNVGTLSIANCRTGYDESGTVQITNFHACHGLVSYGATVTATQTPGAVSSVSSGDPVRTFIANTDNDYDFIPWSWTDTSHAHAPTSPDHADLGITRIGGTYGGQVMTAVFRIINHGPGNAHRAVINAISDSQSALNSFGSMSLSDGYCDNNAECFLTWLPAGDSTTFTVRYSGVPPGDTSSSDRQRAHSSSTASTTTPFCAYARVVGDGSDANLSNNQASCIDATVPVTVALGGATPANRTVQIGALNVPMLDFMLTPASQQTVNSVTIQAQGTGDDHVDVTAVNLYVDKNANGQVDSGDSLIATSAFAANDGSVTMNVSPLYSIAAPTNFLVTYSFAATFAQRLGGGLSLAMLPLLFLPAVWRRKRVVASLMIAMITTLAMTACGGDSATGPPHPTGSSVTFQSTLTGVNVSGSDVAGVSLAGATITVDK
jgi:hypothetical protein